MSLNDFNISPVKTGSKPIINIHISPKCNMACKYCFESKNHMSLVPIHDIIEKVNSILNSSKETVYVDFYGSEISVELDKLSYILKHISKDKVESYTFMTNLLDNVDELMSVIGENSDIITVSLDIGRRINDVNRVDHFGNPTYDKVLKNIKKVIECGKLVRLSTTYDTEKTHVTHDDFFNFINDVTSVGVKTVSLNFLNKMTYDENEIYKIHELLTYVLEYYRSKRDSYINIKIKSEFNLANLEECILSKTLPSCPARKSFTVTGDGYLSHCLYQVCDDKVFKNKSICFLGSIYHDSVDRRNMITDILSTFKCTNCHLLLVCRNACMCMNVDNDGCISSRKSLAKEVLWLYKSVMKIPHIFDIICSLGNHKRLNNLVQGEIFKLVNEKIDKMWEVDQHDE